MKIKAVSGIMVTLLLISMLTLAFNIQPAKASGTIYIRADGNIDPPTAPIQRLGNIYTFTSNISDEIVVTRSNIVIDGKGYLLQGSERGYGFYLYGLDFSVTNVTIKNTNIKGFEYGILLKRSSNNSIVRNNITKNAAGIWLIESSSNNNIAENNITTHKGYGILLGDKCSNNSAVRNDIKTNAYGIVITSSDNTIVENSIAGSNDDGIWLSGADHNSIVGNSITANKGNGIGLRSSSNNSIYHNNFVNNKVNAYVEGAAFYFFPNAWDNGFPSGGNYWSNYTGVDANGDGIGDTPYSIAENHQDRYPLMSPWAPPSVGVKAGDWIKCTYTISGWPAGTPYPEWLKVEFLSVEGTTATVRVTMRMSNGTELSETVPVDIVAGGQAFGLSGFVIPANSTVGDSVTMGGAGFTFNVTIDGETTRNYAGASRTVVYASFSQFESQLTCYWDKQTGVMVEASTTSGSITATGKATETNMWEAVSSPLWMQWWFYAIVAAIIVALAGTVYFLKKRQPPTPTAPPLPTEGT